MVLHCIGIGIAIPSVSLPTTLPCCVINNKLRIFEIIVNCRIAPAFYLSQNGGAKYVRKRHKIMGHYISRCQPIKQVKTIKSIKQF